jgi:ribonuclease HI
MPRVTIYTDGGADPNPGPGGWGAILIHETTKRIRELSGGAERATNNRMELTAAIEAFRALKEPCEVVIATDSEYLRSGITRWVQHWQANNWMRGKKGKKPVENADLWQLLLAVTEPHAITWRWLRGHAGHRFNERADQLATAEIRRFYEALPLDEQVDASIYVLVSVRGEDGLWAASVRFEDREELVLGHEYDVTANQLDILAAASALRALPDGISVALYTLSDYLRNGATQWLAGWKRRGWLTKKGEPVRNQTLWQMLDEEMSARQVIWPSVKDDESKQFVFEDVGQRAQEEFEAMMGRGPDRPDSEGREGWTMEED